MFGALFYSAKSAKSLPTLVTNSPSSENFQIHSIFKKGIGKKPSQATVRLKGHGNEPFLLKTVQHGSLTLPFEPF
jgi:hypothetical protein